jgi:hypothetical protein
VSSKLAVFAGLWLAAGAALADVVVIDPSDLAPATPDVWGPANVRANGSVAITADVSPPGDAAGSIELATANPPIVNGQDKADLEIFFSDPGLVLGDLDALAFAWRRSSASTVPAHLAPVLRITFQTAGGQQGLLVWEAVYQTQYGGAVPTDAWVDEDVLGGRFWMRAYGPGRTIDVYDLTLADWIAAGAVSDGVDTGWDIDADTRVIGLNVGFGSGWGGGDFLGWADQITLGFAAEETTWDFDFVASGLCPASPAATCRLGTTPRAAKLRFVDSAKDARDALRFASARGGATELAALGDPRVDTDYQLCVWTVGDGGPLLVADPLAPAGAGWSARKNGFRYKAAAGVNPDGIRKLRLRAGPDGKTRIRLRAKGSAVEKPALPLAEGDTAVAQLHNTLGECWEASFDEPPLANDARGVRFRGQ